MYYTEPPTDKTIREWYMNSSRVVVCALRNEQAVRAHGPGPFLVVQTFTLVRAVNDPSRFFSRNDTFVMRLFLLRFINNTTSSRVIVISSNNHTTPFILQGFLEIATI